jgi:hypothetical protein
VDENRLNDTAKLVLNINPVISVNIPAMTSVGNCNSKDIFAQQRIWVRNRGNVDITGVSVAVDVSLANGTVVDQQVLPITTTIAPNDSSYVDIIYLIPAEKNYYVDAVAYLTCDSALVRDKSFVQECVDINDLILTVIKPYNQLDNRGDKKDIEVKVKNTSDLLTYNSIKVWAIVEDVQGNRLDSLTETISKIDPEDSVLLPFNNKYTVPNMGTYYLRVFLVRQDNYPRTDSVNLERHTGDGIEKVLIDVFSMQQNVPNPSQNSTFIGYSVPESGEVVFSVHSVTGQLLYTSVLQPESGKHVIELDTRDFASGIYFYSMEYRGQKLVKRMSVKN